jgi:hypothetical protein
MVSHLTEEFSWERPSPPDPYANVLFSRFSPERIDDTVRYTVHFLSMPDMAQERSYLSDDEGLFPELTITQGELFSILRQFAGDVTISQQDVLWYVDATDGLYTTQSTAVDDTLTGHRLRLWYPKPTGVEYSAPSTTSLAPNHPNPFHQSTNIHFQLSKAQHVSLTVTDAYGRVVRRLLDGVRFDAGPHRTVFNASDLPPGVYFCRLHAGKQVLFRKMLLLR